MNTTPPIQLQEFLDKFYGFLTPAVLFLALGVMFIFFFIATAVFLYHWKNYDFNRERIKKVRWLYLSGSLTILFAMCGAAVYYAL